MWHKLSKPSAMIKDQNTGLIGVLDIGVAKVSCYIADIVDGAADDQEIEIIGAGHHASAEGANLAELSNDACVRAAIEKAERMAGATVKNWHVAISGQYIACRRIAVDVKTDQHPILSDDLADCYKVGADMIGDTSKKALHIWPSGYALDGLSNIHNPLGLQGDQLSVFMVGLSAPYAVLDNQANCLERCRVQAASFIAAPLASAIAVLQPEEKKLGTLCIDFGAQTTGFALYKDGRAMHVGAIPLGGQHITQDIAQLFSMSLEAAERTKTVYGTAFCAPGDDTRLIDFTDMTEVGQISVAALAEVIGPRVEEILEMITAQLKSAGLNPVMTRRAVLTGGGSQLQGLCELVEQIMDMKTRLGRPTSILGAPDVTRGPAFSVCAGMLQHLLAEKHNRSFSIPNFQIAEDQNAVGFGEGRDLSRLRKMANWLSDKF